MYEGKPKEGKPTCTFKLSSENFVKMVKKEANPQSLFMSVRFSHLFACLPKPFFSIRTADSGDSL